MAKKKSKKKSDAEWRQFEKIAAELLDRCAKEFGLQRVEGKQSVRGAVSGTEWEIDAKGILDDGQDFLIVECRRYTKSRQSQEHMAAVAYRIKDTGAKGGILVSPMGMQKGAAKIAAAENIQSVQLDPNSTLTDYVLKLVHRTIHGGSMTGGVSVGASVVDGLIRICDRCGLPFSVTAGETTCPECGVKSGGR